MNTDSVSQNKLKKNLDETYLNENFLDPWFNIQFWRFFQLNWLSGLRICNCIGICTKDLIKILHPYTLNSVHLDIISIIPGSGWRKTVLVTQFTMWREDKRDISSDQRGPAPDWGSVTPPHITLLVIIIPTLAVITLSSPRQGSTPLWSDPHPNKHLNFLTENFEILQYTY